MTGCSWSFSLSEVSTMSLHQFVHCGLCFPSLMLLPDISAYTSSLALPVSTCLSTFEGSGLPHVLLFLWDSRRVVAFSVCSVFFFYLLLGHSHCFQSLYMQNRKPEVRDALFLYGKIYLIWKQFHTLKNKNSKRKTNASFNLDSPVVTILLCLLYYFHLLSHWVTTLLPGFLSSPYF